ncbi:hypothetical protein ACHAWO_011176 [Cyclotella atomus]|uniref:Uncharacterized protein n=1 Tax=Cyclotella atomus TaxID=382360 RepID=A0ABD3NTX1_9STRA
MQDQETRHQSADDATSSPCEVDIKADEAVASKTDLHQSIISNMNNVPKFSEEWFRLKEIEISLRNGLSADELGGEATSDQVDEDRASLIVNEDQLHLQTVADAPPSNRTFETIAHEAAPLPTAQLEAVEHVSIDEPEKGIEQIPSLSDAHVPVSMSERDDKGAKESGRSGLERMPSDGVGAVYNNDEDTKQKAKAATLEQVLNDGAPVPFRHGQDEDTKMKMHAATPSILRNENNDAIDAINSRGIEVDGMTNDSSPQFTARQLGFLDTRHVRQSGNTPRGDVESQNQTFVSSLGNTSVTPDAINASISVIPEAYLVEEEKDLALAELVPPWWKRKQNIVALVVLLIVIGAAVGGVQYTKQNEVIVFVANATTAAPSISLAPSSSQTPSFQPSACVDRSSLDRQVLDFVFFNLTQPQCDIDGSHIVVADIHLEGRFAYMYVVFYGWNKGSFDKSQHFVEYLSEDKNDTDIEYDWYYDFDDSWDDKYTVSMSQNTVVIGTPFMNNGTGTVFVYEFDLKSDAWKRLYGAMLPDVETKGARFGESLDIDNDLAVISAPIDDTVFVFLRDRSGWNQKTTIQMENVTDVTVNDNTIAITTSYCQVHLVVYNRLSNEVQYQQQFLEEFCRGSGLGSVALTQNHFAVSANFDQFGSYCVGFCEDPYWLRQCRSYPIYDVVLYHRVDDSQNFTFIQLLNSSGSEQGFSGSLAFEHDFLLVGVDGNKTNTFTFDNNGLWRETLELTTPDQCGVKGYNNEVHISNRNAMVVTSDSVYVYDIEECAYSPSSVPSESPSSSPTNTCFMIEIFANHYNGLKPVWTLEQMNGTNIGETALESEILQSSSPTLRPTWHFTSESPDYDPTELTSTKESKCLKEGRYMFTIYNDPLFYKVTAYGELIIDGRKPGYQETIIFDVPYERDNV